MNQIRGSQSISFGEAPYLISSACVAGSKEAEGPLGKLFDMVNQDDLFGAKTWEEAESTMQKEACVLALGKAHVDAKHVRYLYGGDVDANGVAEAVHAVVPDVLHQLLLTHRPSLMYHQIFQNARFLSGQRQRLPVDGGGTGAGVKGQTAAA